MIVLGASSLSVGAVMVALAALGVRTVGMSLRRAGSRLRLEAGSYVGIRTGSMGSEVRAQQQARIGVLAAGETRTLVVPAGAHVRGRAELVAVIGQPERLQTIHRLVVLPRVDVRSVRSVGSGTRADRRGAFDARPSRVR